MVSGALLFSLPCLVLLVWQSCFAESAAVKAGGCLAQNQPIPIAPAFQLDTNLSGRIRQILAGDKQSEKVFQNKEHCLPLNKLYQEFRLHPNIPDANRIVKDVSSGIFYFTADHYSSFHKVSSKSYAYLMW